MSKKPINDNKKPEKNAKKEEELEDEAAAESSFQSKITDFISQLSAALPKKDEQGLPRLT
jgi:hypothetical protein